MVRETTPQERGDADKERVEGLARQRLETVYRLTDEIKASLDALKPMRGFERELEDRKFEIGAYLQQIGSYSRRTINYARDSFGDGALEGDVQENWNGAMGFVGRLKGAVNRTWDTLDEIVKVNERIEKIETEVRTFVQEAGFGIFDASTEQ